MTFSKNSLKLRKKIQTIFNGKLFLRPLFYNYPHGLRFELSESGTSIDMFLCAMRKAQTIIQDIFPSGSNITVCIRFWSDGSRDRLKRFSKELKALSFKIPAQREIWAEVNEDSDYDQDDGQSYWINIAFEIDLDQVPMLLWCALSVDFKNIKPSLDGLVYFLSLKSELAVFPYDDRGMDVIGNDLEKLFFLYKKHDNYLLDYDREKMSDQFKGL